MFLLLFLVFHLFFLFNSLKQGTLPNTSHEIATRQLHKGIHYNERVSNVANLFYTIKITFNDE